MASENVPACIHEVFVFCFVKTCHILLYQTCTFQIFLTCFPHQCFCYSAVTQLINHSRKLWFCCPAVFADLPVDHNFTKSGVYHKISAKNTIFGRSSTGSHVQQMKNAFADTGWHKKTSGLYSYSNRPWVLKKFYFSTWFATKPDNCCGERAVLFVNHWLNFIQDLFDKSVSSGRDPQ